MNRKLLQFSIVILATDHNPTILNPDFLQMQGIVPSDWGWELAAPSIATPPFATVQYESGVTISVESNKIQVADNKVVELTDSKIIKIVKRYVEVVPHVRYTTVGINFQTAIEIDDHETYLKFRFLKKGSWDSDNNPIKSVGLKFVYPVDSGRLLLSLDSGTIVKSVDKQEQKKSVIIANANFHRDLDTTKLPTSDQIPGCLNKASMDWTRYDEILSGMLPVEQEKNT